MRFLLLVLLACGLPAHAAQNLMPGLGSFETPVVTRRTPSAEGGNPSAVESKRDWISLEYRLRPSGGTITLGLTNEIARTGKQSLYVHFDHVSMPNQSVILASNFIPVTAGTNYVVSIYGRVDAKDPVTSESGTGTAYLKLSVDYFGKDVGQSVGQSHFVVQPLPGAKDHEPLFTKDEWRHFVSNVTTPEGAVFAQITWRWETSSEPGEVNGTMFFDDSSLDGPPAAEPNMTPAPVVVPDTTEGSADAAGTGTGAAAGSAPATSPAGQAPGAK